MNENSAPFGLPRGLTNHLISWYRLDGDFTDSHGGNHGAVVVGTPQWGPDRTGNIGRALYLTGDLGAILPGIVLSGTSFSIQFWAENPQRWILAQGKGEDGYGLHIGVGAKGLRFDYWGNDLVAALGASDGWSHWVLIHDLETGKKSIWHNAKCVASMVTAPYLGSGDITFGRHFTGGGFYIGALDDVAFWQRALSSEDVKTLFGRGTGSPI